jgi:hypothetical protein
MPTARGIDYFGPSNNALQNLTKTFNSLRNQDRMDLEEQRRIEDEKRRGRLTDIQITGAEQEQKRKDEEYNRNKANREKLAEIFNANNTKPASSSIQPVENQEPGTEPFAAAMTVNEPARQYTNDEKYHQAMQYHLSQGNTKGALEMSQMKEHQTKESKELADTLANLWQKFNGNEQAVKGALKMAYPHLADKIDTLRMKDTPNGPVAWAPILGPDGKPTGGYFHENLRDGKVTTFQPKQPELMSVAGPEGTPVMAPKVAGAEPYHAPPNKGFDTMEEAAAEAKKMHEATGKNPAQMPNIEIGPGNKYYPKVIPNPTEVGKSRAEGYGNIRQVTVLDTKNDNQMITMTANDFAASNKEEPGRFVDAAKAKNALTQTALLQDIHGAIKNSKGSVDRLKNEFDEVSRLQLYKAVNSANPTGALSNLIGGQFGKSLTTDQIDYLTDLNQLIENAMAMRSVLGAGQGSDQLRDAIKATVPNKGTFSKEYAQAQLIKFEQQVNRLERGVPGVKLATPKGEIETPPKSTLMTESDARKSLSDKGIKGSEADGWIKKYRDAGKIK